MTRDELLKALEIAPEPIEASKALDSPQSSPAIPASRTALVLDDWSLRRGEESLTGDVLGKIIPSTYPQAPLAAADFLAAAFEPAPKLADRCIDKTRGRYLRQLLESEAYHALHAETQLDSYASELAAGHFAQGWVELAEETERELYDESTPSGDFKADLRALGAAGRALEAATAEVDELRDAQTAMGGLGGDGAKAGQSADLATTKARFERIRNGRQLRRIMELAGRYRRMAQAKQRQKTLHGRDDVVGVECGADLGRLVPSELAALADPDLEWDALRRYLERGMLQREYRGVERKARGPIVVVVDESGSMSGEKIATAKAFALAMGWVATHQRRWIAMVGFSGCCPCNCLAMPPGRWNQVDLLDWLEHFYSGGSDRDIPLVELPRVWDSLGCPKGKTDIIQITDAICHVPVDMRDSFNAWKQQEQAKYYTIVLGHGGAGNVTEVSDKIWVLPDLSLENEAIQELMAI